MQACRSCKRLTKGCGRLRCTESRLTRTPLHLSLPLTATALPSSELLGASAALEGLAVIVRGKRSAVGRGGSARKGRKAVARKMRPAAMAAGAVGVAAPRASQHIYIFLYPPSLRRVLVRTGEVLPEFWSEAGEPSKVLRPSLMPETSHAFDAWGQ